MKVKCIKAKSYNLTLDKEYDATEAGSYYQITNDEGNTCKYFKSFFEPINPKITSGGFNVNFSTLSGGRLNITLNGKTIVYTTLYTGSFGISCGITKLAYLENIAKSIIDCKKIPGDLRTEIYAECIKAVVKKLKYGMLVCSINTNHKYYSLVQDGISHFAENNDNEVYTVDAHNPNSKNPIRLYTIVIHAVTN